MISEIEQDVDLILLETVASVNHARSALTAAQNSTEKPVWLAVTCSDEEEGILRSGEDLLDLKAVVDEFKPERILINCSVPEVIKAALAKISTFGIPFGAYANGFNQITNELIHEKDLSAKLHNFAGKRQDLTPEKYADFVMQWVE